MKIIHISPVFLPYRSGMTNVVYNQARQLVLRGHEVEVLTLHYDKSWPGEETIDDIKIHRIKPLLKYGNGGFVPGIGQWLKQEIKNTNEPFLIHLHIPFFGGQEIIWMMRSFGSLKNVKLIVQYHHDAQLSFFTEILSVPSRFIFKPLLKSADKVIVSSLDYARDSDLRNLIDNRFIEVPLGVDHSRFMPKNKRPEARNKNILKILFVGALDRAHHFKGLDILLQAFRKLANQNYNLQIAGSGDLSAYYQRLSSQLQIDKYVEFIGFASDEELPKIYKSADLFVFPSTGKAEAFGLVVLEAMSSGLPVLASDLPGVRTLIQNKDFLVKPGSIDSLAEKLELVLNDKELLVKAGLANRQLVEEKYTWEKSVDQLEKLYKSAQTSDK